MIKGQMYVSGNWLECDSHFEVANPYDGSIVGTAADANPNHVNSAVNSARKGADIMASVPAHKRVQILSETSFLIRKKREELARIITLEAGKSIKTSRAEVERSARTFSFASHEAGMIAGQTTPMDVVPGAEERMAFYQPFPVGVVAAITPFNFPLNLVAHKIAPAIAAGNSVILKPSPKTPFTAIKLVEILLEAGLPPEAINLVTSFGVEVGEALVVHKSVDMISFTGSLAVGAMIKEKSGIKRVCLELGSNSACVIEPDSDIDLAVERSVIGAFSYAGQVCISLQTIYLHKDIFDLFTEKLLKSVERIKLGDPMDPDTDYGPMVSENEAKRCEEWIKDAQSKGANVLCGGIRKGVTIPPTVITNVAPDMKVVCREVFGPVVSLIPYEDFDKALDKVNDSEYGLQAGVFTKDIKKAFTAFKKLKVGGVMVNDAPTFRTDNMPYGGVKNSGLGREGVRFAMSEMMEKRIMVFNL